MFVAHPVPPEDTPVVNDSGVDCILEYTLAVVSPLAVILYVLRRLYHPVVVEGSRHPLGQMDPSTSPDELDVPTPAVAAYQL